MIRLLTALSLVFLLGCATPYESSGFNGGFSETQISKNMFKVYFEGNSNTKTERASDFIMLRSAELTLREGYKYFSVKNKKEIIEKDSFTTPLKVRATSNSNMQGISTFGSGFGSYSSSSQNSSSVKITGGRTYKFQKPKNSQTITCYKNKPKGVFSYDAVFLNKSLQTKYELDK